MPVEPIAEEEIPGGESPAARAAAERPESEFTRAEKKLQEEVAELYVLMGTMLVAPVDGLAGRLIVKGADDLAEQWVRLARTQPSVRRVLNRLVEAGGWTGVLMAHAMIAVPVLANRGLLPNQAAVPIATMVMMGDPEAAPLFTHPRWREVGLIVDEQPEYTPGDERGANGNSAGD